jgi:transposase
MTSKKKQTRIKHSTEYKVEALALAERIGISAAARQLGRAESQLYGWRNKQLKDQSQSVADQQLAAENARLKRQLAEQAEELAILKKAAAYFARNVK